MMPEALMGFLSWQFAVGFVVGVVVQRAWCVMKARREDRIHPLPDGRKHRVTRLNRVWVVGFLAVAIQLYVVAEVQDTSTRVTNLAADTQACQAEFFEALAARSDITAEDRRLSTKIDDEFTYWLRDLLNPADDSIANLPTNDPVRQRYALQITIEHFGVIRDASEERAALEKKRNANPLPEPNCS